MGHCARATHAAHWQARRCSRSMRMALARCCNPTLRRRRSLPWNAQSVTARKRPSDTSSGRRLVRDVDVWRAVRRVVDMAETNGRASTPDARTVFAQVDRLIDDARAGQLSGANYLARKFDHGLAWVHFPPGYGGMGAAPGLQAGVEETLDAAGLPRAPGVTSIGYGMCAPALVT